MDRASGSGVFARDPDALLDLIELETTEDIKKQETNKAVCNACIDYLNEHFEWEDDVSQDDMLSSNAMKEYCKKKLTKGQYNTLEALIAAASKQAQYKTAWRIEGTLREFPKFEPVNLWFDYPVHKADRIGVLNDIETDTDKGSWRSNFRKKKTPEQLKKERKESLETQFESLKSFNPDKEVTVKELAESMGVSEKTVRNRLKEHGGFWIDEGNIGKK